MFLSNNITYLLKDAAELDQLISYLINKEDSEGVVLLGQSTGCQVSQLPLANLNLVIAFLDEVISCAFLVLFEPRILCIICIQMLHVPQLFVPRFCR